jgi:cell fate (sporulation/competence/biofilm development) regulator YlbF (YheA/YmcA/DUF963 family)
MPRLAWAFSLPGDVLSDFSRRARPAVSTQERKNTMFKFLRKHSMWLLVVFGVGLMIVFLVPGAITRLSEQAGRSSATWATVGEDDEKISYEEFEASQAELQTLQRIPFQIDIFSLIETPAHWFLLVREAEQSGIVGGSASDYLTQEQLAQISASAGSDPRVTNRAIGKLMGVQKLFAMHQSAAPLSDNRLRHRAERMFRAVDADLVFIQSEPLESLPTPTEDEILAHFEQYKDLNPGEGDYGFGYRWPDRFKIEWIVITADDLRAMAEGGEDFNGVELYKHWRRYQEERGFPAIENGAEIPAVVREDLIAGLVEQHREEIRKFVQSQIVTTQRPLKSSEGYLVLPDNWTELRVNYEQLAQDLRNEFPSLPLPAYEAVGDRWLTLNDLFGYEGVGRATLDPETFGVASNRQPYQSGDLIAAIKEFEREIPLYFQAGVTSPPMNGPDGSIYFLRVTEADPAHAPMDVAEVRDDIIDNLKRLAHYEQLKEEAYTLEADAEATSLLALAVSEKTAVRRVRNISMLSPSILNFMIQQNRPLTPFPSTLPEIGRDEETIMAIIEHSLALPVDRPTRDIPRNERTFVLEHDKQMMMIVVELTNIMPLDSELYAAIPVAQLASMISSEELTDTGFSFEETFGFETMKQRHNLQFTREIEDEELETPETEDGAAAPETETASTAG